MDLFPDRGHVRLRSRALGTYLHADSDGAVISFSGNRALMNVAWAVHVYQDDRGNMYVLLQGAAYGLYLASTGYRADPEVDGCQGICVYQHDYDEPEVQAIMWQVVVSGSGDDVLLRHANGGYLCANGRYPTIDDSGGRRSMMMLWIVEPIPARQDMPGLPRPQIEDPHPGDHDIRMDPSEIRYPWRLIRYVLAMADGWYSDDLYFECQFRGNSILHLRNWMVYQVGLWLTWNFLDVVMCVRPGRYARLSPMLIDLPRDGYGETLFMVVVMTGTPAEAHLQLRYPDIDAEQMRSE